MQLVKTGKVIWYNKHSSKSQDKHKEWLFLVHAESSDFGGQASTQSETQIYSDCPHPTAFSVHRTLSLFPGPL